MVSRRLATPNKPGSQLTPGLGASRFPVVTGSHEDKPQEQTKRRRPRQTDGDTPTGTGRGRGRQTERRLYCRSLHDCKHLCRLSHPERPKCPGGLMRVREAQRRRETDRRTHGRTDRRTHGRTDGRTGGGAHGSASDMSQVVIVGNMLLRSCCMC